MLGFITVVINIKESSDFLCRRAFLTLFEVYLFYRVPIYECVKSIKKAKQKEIEGSVLFVDCLLYRDSGPLLQK